MEPPAPCAGGLVPERRPDGLTMWPAQPLKSETGAAADARTEIVKWNREQHSADHKKAEEEGPRNRERVGRTETSSQEGCLTHPADSHVSARGQNGPVRRQRSPSRVQAQAPRRASPGNPAAVEGAVRDGAGRGRAHPAVAGRAGAAGTPAL